MKVPSSAQFAHFGTDITEAIARALTGSAGVFSALQTKPSLLLKEAFPSEAIRVLIETAYKAGTERAACITGIGL